MVATISTFTEEESKLKKSTFSDFVNFHLSSYQGKTRIKIVRLDTKIGFKTTEQNIVNDFVEYDKRVNEVIFELNQKHIYYKLIRVANEHTAVTIIVISPNQFVSLGFYLQGALLRCTIDTKEDPY